MIHHTLFVSLTVVLVSGHRYAKSIEPQSRIGDGYTTSGLHGYSGFNDLQAERAVNVDFGQGGTKYPQAPGNHLFTRTSLSSEPKGANLFNVGYNLSFNENNYSPRKKEQQRYTHVNNKKFENAEVITGRLKQNEKVRAPSSNNDQTPLAFLKQKQISSKYTSSPINTKSTGTKYITPEREQISKYPSQSPTFTYNTQQNIFKDVIKSTRPDPIQLSPEFETSYATRGRWRNLSPAAPSSWGKADSGQKHTNIVTHMQPSFNHEFALKNSESFDFSNAHGEIRIGDSAGTDSSPEGSEQHEQIVKNQGDNYANLNIEAHIPKNLRGVKPLPLDTSLLKDPVLTTNTFQEPTKYDRVIPIHFDIRPIQTVMETELSKGQNFAIAQQQNLQGAQQTPQNYRYPANYGQPHQPGNGVAYEDPEQSPSQTNFRIYGKPAIVDKDRYMVGSNYGKKRANYEEDVYKIMSMRPPSISQQFRY